MSARKLPMKYWEAIVWIAANDDNEWLKDNSAANVTLTMVADIWNVPIEQATEHLRKALEGK